MRLWPALFLLLWLGALAPGQAAAQEVSTVPRCQALPHDARLYTQGLFCHGGFLYESAGQYGQSVFLKRRLDDAAPVAQFRLPPEFFAEGAALAGGEVYLLTWRENTLFVLDPETLAEKRRLKYEGEGWGLAFDGQKLWRSDGSASLWPHRVGDFAPAGPPLAVTYRGRPVTGLNELEWDAGRGAFLANVYGQDFVAVIDPATGDVGGLLDCRGLRQRAEGAGLDTGLDFYDTVLNGLALTPDGRRLIFTGKYWPELYSAPAWRPRN